MSINFADAVNAYSKAFGRDELPGMDARDAAAGDDFAGVLSRAADATVKTLEAGETESLKAAAGQADLTQVVTAISEAELTLQTVVAVRDKVIDAYQEILRMPI